MRVIYIHTIQKDYSVACPKINRNNKLVNEFNNSSQTGFKYLLFYSLGSLIIPSSRKASEMTDSIIQTISGLGSVFFWPCFFLNCLPTLSHNGYPHQLIQHVCTYHKWHRGGPILIFRNQKESLFSHFTGLGCFCSTQLWMGLWQEGRKHQIWHRLSINE